jgi:hypothetical protein
MFRGSRDFGRPVTTAASGYFTVSVTMVLWLNWPEVPVKVSV